MRRPTHSARTLRASLRAHATAFQRDRQRQHSCGVHRNAVRYVTIIVTVVADIAPTQDRHHCKINVSALGQHFHDGPRCPQVRTRYPRCRGGAPIWESWGLRFFPLRACACFWSPGVQESCGALSWMQLVLQFGESWGLRCVPLLVCACFGSPGVQESGASCLGCSL